MKQYTQFRKHEKVRSSLSNFEAFGQSTKLRYDRKKAEGGFFSP